MMPIDATGYQQLCAPEPADTPSSDGDADTPEPLERRLPHSNLPAGQRPRQLNGVKAFLAPDDSDSDSDSDDDALGNESGSPGHLVTCRHLALHYCIESLENNRHTPSAQDLNALRRCSPKHLDTLRNRLSEFSQGLHVVCARDLGVFMRQCFNEMTQELSPEDENVELMRQFYMSTGSHAMALRLVCRPASAAGHLEFEVSVYDPNFTDHHVQAVVNGLYDFIARPLDHGLLSYLLSRQEDQATRLQRMANYFDLGTNPGMQVMLYELRLDEPPKASPPLLTDWSSSARASLYQAYLADCRPLYHRALDEVLGLAAEGPFPHLLKESKGFDYSLLWHLMWSWSEDPEPLQRWRSVWAQTGDEMKAHLAAAHDYLGNPLGFLLMDVKPGALAAWIDLLQSLTPSLALKVLATRDVSGGAAVWRALSHPQTLRALDPMLQRCATEQPEAAHALLATQNAHGHTALGAEEVKVQPQALPVWVKWVAQWVPRAARLELLTAPDSEGFTALMRTLDDGDTEWIAAWTEALELLPQDDQFALLQALDDRGQAAVLRAIRVGNTQFLKAWSRCLSVVSPEQRAELLAGRDASGRHLLAQDWCQQYEMEGPVRRYLRSESTVQAQHRALLAWAKLLTDLPIDARLDMLAGASPSGEPAWVTLSKQDLNDEVVLLGNVYEQHVPPEQRDALSRRLSVSDANDRARLLAQLGENRSQLASLQFSAMSLENWLDPSLVQAMDAIADR